MTLGERIASLRKEKNLSQEGLGELVGVSRQAVSKWEADRALPDVNNCVAMSRVFGISLAELLELEEGGAADNSSVEPRSLEDGQIGGQDFGFEKVNDTVNPSSFVKDLTPAQLQVVERMMEKYTAAQRRLHRRFRWPLILLGGLLIVGAAWLWQWLTDMNRTIDYLHGEVASLRSEIISGVSDQLQASLREENHLGANYVTKVKEVDLKESQITYVLEAEFTEPVLVYRQEFMIRQGEKTWTVDMKSAGGLRHVGEITCPIQDDTAFYMIVEEDNGTIHREKVAVWNPEERYTLFVDGWVRWASLEQSGLIPGAAEAVTVYISGFARGYDQGELGVPLQIAQAEVAVMCNQDIVEMQELETRSLNAEEATGHWFFRQDVDVAVPDNAVALGDVLTFELRVVDSYGRNYKQIISQYQVQQDGKVSPLSGEVTQVIE